MKQAGNDVTNGDTWNMVPVVHVMKRAISCAMQVFPLILSKPIPWDLDDKFEEKVLLPGSLPPFPAPSDSAIPALPPAPAPRSDHKLGNHTWSGTAPGGWRVLHVF